MFIDDSYELSKCIEVFLGEFDALSLTFAYFGQSECELRLQGSSPPACAV